MTMTRNLDKAMNSEKNTEKRSDPSEITNADVTANFGGIKLFVYT